MRISTSLLFACLAACAGKAPVSQSGNPDAPPADAPPADTAQMLSGTVMDYFGNVALPDTAIATDGIAPEVDAQSAMDGTFQMQIAVGSKLFLVASRPNYRPTRSAPVEVDDMPVMQDVYAMSEQDVKRQYISLGKLPTAGTAFVVVDLQDHNGVALSGIPLTSITLVDANMQPVPGVIGPYFFGMAGDIDPAVTTAPVVNGRSRVAFLDVPPGTFTVSVIYPSGATGNTQDNTTISTAADGATLALSGGLAMPGTGTGSGSGSGSGVGSGSGSGSATAPSFANDIYPKLQRAASGGLGCANCHTAGGPAAILIYDDPAATVLANIKAAPGVIDLATPADSLLLVRPLYEPPPLPQDHPNATFLDTNDPNYQLFLLWITDGAQP